MPANLSPVQDDPSKALHGLGALEGVEDRAFKRGRDSARITAQVESHEKRLNAINGSLDRHARAVESVSERLDVLTASVDKSTAIAKARADTAADLAKTAARAAVDKRTFIFAIVGATATIATVIIAALALGLGH